MILYRCDCNDLLLIIKKIEFETVVHSSNWLKDYIRMAIGTIKLKKQKRWIARCGQCDKLLIASYTKKKIIDTLKSNNIKYSFIRKENK